jgi:hypothetical protein
MSLERILGTRNYATQLILHGSVWYEATKLLGDSMVFQKAMSPREKQRNQQHVIWCFKTNTQANRVAIVSSVIIKIFNPCKHWTVTIQPSVYMISKSVFICYFSAVVRFSFVSVLFLFNSICLIIRCSILIYSVLFPVLILALYSRYFDPRSPYHNHPASQ